MKKITLKQCFDTRAYSQNYYPLWRKPLSYVSFYLLYFLVNFLKIENPYIISFATIIFGIFGAFFIAFGNVYFGSFILIVSYIFDLLDGKLARLQGTQNISARFIDWCYHSIVPSFSYLALGFYIFTNTGKVVYIFLAAGCTLFFLHKMFLSMLYLNVEKDILIAKKEYTPSSDYEKSIELQYSGILKNKFIFYSYFYLGKLFIDSTDLLFGIVLFLLFGYESMYLMIAFIINFLLWIISFYTKTLALGRIEGKK